MKKIKTTVIYLAISLLSISGSGQTFTYLESFDLTDTDDRDELCLTVYDGKIFIQDEGDDEVDIYSATSPYGFIMGFGSSQFGNSEDGIAVYNNFIFVADDDDEDIEVFKASDYSFVTQINTSAYVDDIEGFIIAFGKIFVVDNSGGKVSVFSANSPYSYMTDFGATELDIPASITSHDGNVFVVDEDDSTVHVFNGTTYSHLGSFGDGNSYGEGIAAICDYILVLEDEGPDYIDVYSAFAPYTHITTFGEGEISNIECIAVNGNLIYIADSDNNEIDIFELEEGCRPIPTLSQWSIIALGMIMLILGLVARKDFISLRFQRK